jgi:branched-chain amino acid transport system substrate-binding protein
VDAGVSVVLGAYGSYISIAGSPIFEKAGIPAITISNTNPVVTIGNSHYFRICYLDPFQGVVQAHFAREQLDANKAYVLVHEGDVYYGDMLSKTFMEAFGKENCVFENIPENTYDYSAFIANAKASGADVFFSPTSLKAAVLIVDQAHIQNLGIPLLGGDTWDSYQVLEVMKGKSMEVFVTTNYYESGTKFDMGLKKYINSNPDALSKNFYQDSIADRTALAYDAYYVALEALKMAGSTDSVDVMKALPHVKYKGVTGNISFDNNGDAIRDSAIIKKIDARGEWEFFAVQYVRQDM